MAIPGDRAIRSATVRRLLQAVAERHRTGGRDFEAARQGRQARSMDENGSKATPSICGRNSQSNFSGAGILCSAAAVQNRLLFCGFGGEVAIYGGPYRRLSLSAIARSRRAHVSGYTESALDWWANRIRLWSDGREPEDAKHVLKEAAKSRRSRDVYVYFDNDVKVKSPTDAMSLSTKLGVGIKTVRDEHDRSLHPGGHPIARPARTCR